MNLGELKKELEKFDNDELDIMVTTGSYNEPLFEIEKMSEQISKNPDISRYEYILLVG